MKTELTGAALFADSLRYTLQQNDSANSFVTPRFRPAKLRAREIAWRGAAESPFRVRDPLTSRRLLVAS